MLRRVGRRSSSSPSSPITFQRGEAYGPESSEHKRCMYVIVLLYPLSAVFPYLVHLLFDAQHLVSTRLWEQPENPQVEAEVLAAAIVVLQFLQFILCHERYRRNHWLVQWGAWAAFYFPLTLAPFAVGMMLRFRRPYWLVAIFFAAGQTDTMAIYKLDDDRQSMRRFAKRTLSLAYLIVAFLEGVSCQRPMEIHSIVLGLLIFSVDLMISSRKMVPSSDICLVAAEHAQSQSTAPDTKPTSPESCRSSTSVQAQSTAPETKPTSPESCWSSKNVQAQSTAPDTKPPSPESCQSSTKMIPSCDLVDAENDVQAQPTIADSEPDLRRIVVAVGSLESLREAVSGCTTFQGIQDLASYSSGLEDTCLSSALFLQLLQRYVTPQLAADSTSSLNLVFRDLLVEKSMVDVYARAFNVVEVQLSFMYDYFFSTYGSPSHTSYQLYRDYSMLKIAFLSSILSLIYPADEATAKPELSTSVYAIHALILLELCQLLSYLTSNWLVVSYMCERARNSKNTSWLLRIFGNLPRKEGSQECSWQSELGQYSLIEDFDHTSLKQRLLGRRPPRGTLASPVALSDEIKRWVFYKAVSAERTGLTFLRQNQKELSYDELSWALSQETEMHTILIWHIATWFCGKTEEKRAGREVVLSSSDYVVATKLSSYCAYLVVYLPELLPGHHTVTASIFHKAVKEAELKFQGETSSDERFATVKTWSVVEDSSDQRRRRQDLPSHQGILKLGIKLGRQLIGKEDRRWKIMADFWAEMLLLMAQSENATAHIEHLANGGQFLTHLWAFLYNAGMHKDRAYIKRNKDSGDKSPPSDH
ncbi:unnamed protein product [Urochloa decumbens]|uniref:DUF4220 domain-containing protein n=1 Tax=Urochloa decumbens TaxID=240449 RepID=A0ABC8WL13_9POAL